ncbi:MAG: OmpH family outer membrane protein [Ignavibacteria bacterium]|nr:OmpH family outer membrane protein [Ignavibacteria bacterium]
MKKCLIVFLILLSAVIVLPNSSVAQKIGYISSQTIREKYPDAQQAQLRLQSMVDDWKRELDEQQKTITDLENEIKKNRLVWTDMERHDKEMLMERKRKEREEFATKKFGPNGEYDGAVTLVFKGVEDKIFASVQEVSLDEGYDIVWDKSSQPLIFINPKYDMTVKVMKKLGIQVEDLEKQQEAAVKNDPRNKEKEKPATGTRRTKTRTDEVPPPKDAPTKDAPAKEIPRQ